MLTYNKATLPYEITQSYLPPDIGERSCLNPNQVGRDSIYLPRRDRRRNWP